jgi:cysteine-rich repeat protein
MISFARAPGRLSCIVFVASLAGVVACDAPRRDPVAEDCGNHVDDDQNGQTDCDDAACAHRSPCAQEICGNNLDDDSDGRFDCADSDCAAQASCGGVGMCGNDTIDPGEDCDGAHLGGRTCVTQGFAAGALACKACDIDTSGCTNVAAENCNNQFDDDQDGSVDCADNDCAQTPICLCGNGRIDELEFCDGTLMPMNESCESHGFPGGVIKCDPACLGVDLSECEEPTCGDGSVAMGETCDDGNNVPGDGCDAECQVELGAICDRAKPLSPGVNEGDTLTGTSGFSGTCSQGSGLEKIFVYTPITSGTLTVVMNSPTDQGIFARSTCNDDATELGCASFAPGGASEALSLAVTAGVPLYLFVDATLNIFDPSAGTAGPFTLIVVQTP